MEHVCGLHGCRVTLNSEAELSDHQIEMHNCTFPGCDKTYRNPESRRSHLQRAHFVKVNLGKSHYLFIVLGTKIMSTIDVGNVSNDGGKVASGATAHRKSRRSEPYNQEDRDHSVDEEEETATTGLNIQQGKHHLHKVL